MALAAGQIHLVGTGRDLLMGEGTRFDLQDAFNPFLASQRDPQGSPRPYAHGSLTGAEWQDARVVPLRVIANGANADVSSTRAAILEMGAAFAAVGSTGEVAELRFRLDGDPDEFVLFGRPRGPEPDMSTIGLGYAYISGAFVAADPRIYSGAETVASTGLPVQSGGLTVPVTAPLMVTGRLIGGRLTLVNAGTAATGLRIRIDGPAPSPRLVLTGSDGILQTIAFDLDLGEGQWLDIDTTRYLALLNGLPQSNQRGRARWTFGTHPLPPGPATLRFFAGGDAADAQVTVTYRSAYW